MHTTSRPLTGQSRLDQFFTSRGKREGEGCRGSTTTAGADHWQQILRDLPGNSGYPPPVSGNTRILPSPATSVHKRSYKRACRRAIRTGYAHYHGMHLQLSDFPKRLVHSLQAAEPAQQQYIPRAVQGNRQSSRIRTLCWNAGGMSQATFHEVRYWLRHNPMDVVIILETKWSFSSSWEDADWSYLHTATGQSRSGGVLTMIAKSFAKSEQLGFDHVLPGRIMHVRVHEG